MPIIRKLLAPEEVYPTDIRYDPDTDTVQRLIGDDWVDAPESDPRTHTTLPPRITSDSNCDAAQSIVDAMHGQIDDILTAIDNSQTAFTIAGLILGLFVFGVFDIFVALALALANAMLDAGEGALSDALTEPVYEQFKCILYCHMDTNGRLAEGSLGDIQSEVSAMIGGLAATVLNAMTGLAGEGGMNNLASLGTSTGDCSGCECAEPCADADSFIAGTVNSVTDNHDGTVTINISSVAAGDGTQYVAWGNRTDPDSPCCTYEGNDAFDGTALGSATQPCGSSTETLDNLSAGMCLHYFHFYGNFTLTTPFTCNVTFSAACP